MSRREKLLSKIKDNPKDVHFDDLGKLLEWDGWNQKSTRTSSSHYVYKKKGVGKVTIVKGSDNKVKPEYVKKALEAMGVQYE